MLFNKLLLDHWILCVVYEAYCIDQMSLKYLFLTCLLILSFTSLFFLFFTSYYFEMISKLREREHNATAKQQVYYGRSIPILIDVNRSKSQQCRCQHSYMTCDSLPPYCVYGAYYNINCTDTCNTRFIRSIMCRYCYQTDIWEHNCTYRMNCLTPGSPRNFYKTNCTVNNQIICLGSRNFHKRLRCNWTKGYRWSTALILSVTVGGFGVDRFYLGHWQEGIGKLFSFGGLGVWTLVDILLIAIRYLGPEDGSLYI